MGIMWKAAQASPRMHVHARTCVGVLESTSHVIMVVCRAGHAAIHRVEKPGMGKADEARVSTYTGVF